MINIKNLIDLKPFRKHRDWCHKYPTCQCDFKEVCESVDEIGEAEISTASLKDIDNLTYITINNLQEYSIISEAVSVAIVDKYYLIPKKKP